MERKWRKSMRWKKFLLGTKAAGDMTIRRDFHNPYCSTFPARIYWTDRPKHVHLCHPPATVIHKSIKLEISSCDNDSNLKSQRIRIETKIRFNVCCMDYLMSDVIFALWVHKLCRMTRINYVRETSSKSLVINNNDQRFRLIVVEFSIQLIHVDCVWKLIWNR